MNLDTSLLESLAWRALHLKRAGDCEAGSALSMFHDATTPENVIELLRQLERQRDTLAALGRDLESGPNPDRFQRDHLEAAQQAAVTQRQEIEALKQENRTLNERALAPTDTHDDRFETSQPSAGRVDWKLVPVSFIEDALCAADLVFALRHALTSREITASDVQERVQAYANQLEHDGYRWSPFSSSYPEHPLLELAPPALLDQEIVRDAQLWRDQLWHNLEVVDVQHDDKGSVRKITVWNRESGETQRLTPVAQLSL